MNITTTLGIDVAKNVFQILNSKLNPILLRCFLLFFQEKHKRQHN